MSLAIVAVTSPPMTVSAAPTDVQPTDAQYFIDFRSRAGYVFGHTYIVYGRLNMRGQPVEERYAGIYPLDNGRGLVFGSVLPVAASVRGLEEDRKAAPTNVYRRRITATQYARLSAAVSSCRRNRASVAPAVLQLQQLRDRSRPMAGTACTLRNVAAAGVH
jgi:hypothetical protein